MKVILPSKLIPSVELRQPTLGDIRDLNDLNGSLVIKSALVRKCCDVDIAQISILDRDFLFFMLVASESKNILKFSCKCPVCEKPTSVIKNFSDFEVFDLGPKSSLSVSMFWGLRKWSFRILRVEDEDFAIQKCEEWGFGYDEDIIKDILSSKVIYNKKFDYSTYDSFKKDFENKPLRVLATANMFDRLLFHGINPVVTHTCDKCGAKIETPISLSGECCRIAQDQLMSMYAHLSSEISFNDFLKLSLPEYDDFLESLKKKNNGER